MSEIESAPATMPVTGATTFPAALAAPAPDRVSRSATSRGSPHRYAGATTAAKPAHDTGFGSSNRAETARRAWMIASGGCPLRFGPM
jgi:hypothetical protein